MLIHEVKPSPGSRHRRQRLGRGNASGRGNYSGRGMKGQKARAGHKFGQRFEGGQTPLVKRLPYRRGFTNIFRVEYTAVNVRQLERFQPGTEVTPELLKETGVLKTLRRPVKVLGQGELTRPLVVSAQGFSATARRKIEAAGGLCQEVALAGDAGRS